MTIKGTIEARISSGMTSNANNELFVSLYNAFSNLTAIGVTRIAYNRGNSGTGMSYWDAGSPPGNGAWALFRFGNATIPFYALLQGANMTTTSGFAYAGYAGCAPCVTVDGNSSNYNSGNNNCVSIAIAMNLDGSSPWNGTTVNTGTDTKGSPVWTAGSSTLMVFPRCNASGGTQATNKEAASNIAISNNDSSPDAYFDVYYGGKYNLLVDENNILITTDGAANGTHSIFYFGKYAPRVGFTIQVPYVMLNNAKASWTTAPFLNSVTYGTLSNSSGPVYGTGIGDGGIVHPTASSGVKIACVDYLGAITNPVMFPSRIMNAAGRFDSFPILVGMSETSNFGLLGNLIFLRYSSGMESGWQSPDRRITAIGVNGAHSVKFLIPWDGATAYSSGVSRIGVSF